MVYGTYLNTTEGRLYLAVENGRVVRLTGGAAEKGDVVIGERGSGQGNCGAVEGVFGVDKRGIVGGTQIMPDEADIGILDRALVEITEYLEGKRRFFDVPVQMSGTPFQKKVWEALCRIPYGETRSYGEIAKQVGSPKGARAVGMACGRNPIMILVPCHRVVGSTGKLVGFGGGLPMKEHLLALEGRNR